MPVIVPVNLVGTYRLYRETTSPGTSKRRDVNSMSGHVSERRAVYHRTRVSGKKNIEFDCSFPLLPDVSLGDVAA